MSHEITLFAPETADTDSIKEQVNNATSDVVLLSEFDSEAALVEYELSSTPSHVRASVVASDQENRQALIDALSGVVDGLGWGLVKYRRRDIEYSREKYSNNPDYYPPECDRGLRAPVVVSREGLFTVSIDNVAARVGGEDVPSTSETFDITPTADTRRRDRLVVGGGGITHIAGDESSDPVAPDVPTDTAPVATLEVHPGKLTVIETEKICTPETTSQEIIAQHGDVPSHFTE